MVGRQDSRDANIWLRLWFFGGNGLCFLLFFGGGGTEATPPLCKGPPEKNKKIQAQPCTTGEKTSGTKMSGQGSIVMWGEGVSFGPFLLFFSFLDTGGLPSQD